MDLIPDHPVELFKPADHILLGEPGGTWPLIVIKPPPTAPSCYDALSAAPMGASVVQGALLLAGSLCDQWTLYLICPGSSVTFLAIAKILGQESLTLLAMG